VTNEIMMFIILMIVAIIATFFVLLVTRSFLPDSRDFEEFMKRFFLIYSKDISKDLLNRRQKIFIYVFISPLVAFILLYSILYSQ
jgi:hypothetical protein